VLFFESHDRNCPSNHKVKLKSLNISNYLNLSIVFFKSVDKVKKEPHELVISSFELKVVF
jgi:hypothetical protein